VVAFDPYLPGEHENWNVAEKAAFDELLATSDVITVHCPLNAETRGMIGATELARVKMGAVLINSARGGIVEEAACAAALRTGPLAAAALDVFDYEPIRSEAGKLFAGIPNVILTPHISGVTAEANHRVSLMTVESVAAVLRKGR
jgi:(S)-sulfolactate dehydrogenase